MDEDLIYFDNNSTTRLDNNVLNAMLPYFTDLYANASSSHYFGLRANRAVEAARGAISDLINSDTNEIFFTSGATEGINLVLKGLSVQSNKKHIITCRTEHKAVLDSCKYLETIGFEVTYLGVDRDGIVDFGELEASIRNNTLAICLMWVNNETGVICDLGPIGRIAKERGVFFICDATQGIGKIPMDVVKNGVDFITFSAHKFHGPKGVGGVYINRDSVKPADITTLIHGGGHENGFRSGTLNVPGIVGLGRACEIASVEMQTNCNHITYLKDILEAELLRLKGCLIFAKDAYRIHTTVNFMLPDLDSSVFIASHKVLAISNGSACTSRLVEPSHVITSMGFTDKEALSGLRVSLSKWNTTQEIDKLISYFRNLGY